jgi:hypothetical protein
MEGLQYIIDDKGKKKAVVIDLDLYGDLWEDIHDILVTEARKSEPRVKWEVEKSPLKASPIVENIIKEGVRV